MINEIQRMILSLSGFTSPLCPEKELSGNM
jgi:hypothetical protein